MKKGWKIGLTVAAVVAGLVPYYHKKDEETGASVQQALLWSRTKKPDGETTLTIGLHLGTMPLPKATEGSAEENTESTAEDVAETVEEVLNETEEAAAEVL